MDILTETFQLLKETNLVKTETDFSLHWLHKSERYYSMIKHSEREASVGALCTLLARLRDAGERVELEEQRRSAGLGRLEQQLAEKLHQRALAGAGGDACVRMKS